MHILFLSQVLPYPLDAGPKMRSYFVLRYLAQQHEVTLLTFVRATDRPEALVHLAEFCQTICAVPMQRSWLRDVRFLTQSLLTQKPFLILRDHVPSMAAKIGELVKAKHFDVIHADQLWMAPYALIAQKELPQAKLVLDQHNAVYLIPQRLAEATSNLVKQHFLAGEARRLMAFEPEICHRFDHVVWVTAEDFKAVNALSSPFSNGYPPSTIIPISANPTEIQPLKRSGEKYRITFLGGLHWPPNAQGILWFAEHVFPLVRTQIPEALLTIIGKSPPTELGGEGIEVTGYVVDPLPYLAETAVFIVPLHAGGGMRVKILDAWSWGLPVVSTTVGAEGINVEHEKNILQADTSQAFAEAIVRIFRSPLLAQKLGENGRQTVVEQYNWQRVYTTWDKIYADLV